MIPRSTSPRRPAGRLRRLLAATAAVPVLGAAKGAEFDRLFLVGMIKHHEGAIKMVDDLFKSPGAGQEVDTNVFANDVVTAQSAEIGIMRRLLAQLPPK